MSSRSRALARGLLGACVVAACLPATASAASAAQVLFAFGEVSARSAEGRSRPLSKGSEVQTGETVATGKGRAQLRFADGAYMSLQPDTEFKIEQFRYSGEKNNPNDGVVMNLVKGGLRTVTGAVGSGNPDGYKLKTTVATIGIRGTEYSVSYGNSITVHCANGTIILVNDAGSLLLGAGQSGLVTSISAQPRQTSGQPFLPPRSGGSTSTTEKPSDPNNPLQEANLLTPQSLVGGGPVLFGTVPGTFMGVVSGAPPGAVPDATLAIVGGGLTGFSDSVFGPINIGSGGTVSVAGNDGIVSWGRWLGGTTTGLGPFGNQDLSVAGPLHFAAGIPVTSMPTGGSATYSMIGATPPSCTFGCTAPGVLSSSLVVDFGTVSANFHGSFTVSGNTVSTPGPGIAVGLGGPVFFASGMLNGPYSGQGIDLAGALSGSAAARAGVVYTITVDPGEVNGAIVYSRGAITP